AVVESLEDLYRVQRKELAPDKVRRIEIKEALVDTGATGLYLPRALVQQLGLLPLLTRRAVTTAGIRHIATLGSVRLVVEGRDWFCDAQELDDACPVLIE